MEWNERRKAGKMEMTPSKCDAIEMYVLYLFPTEGDVFVIEFGQFRVSRRGHDELLRAHQPHVLGGVQKAGNPGEKARVRACII